MSRPMFPQVAVTVGTKTRRLGALTRLAATPGVGALTGLLATAAAAAVLATQL